MRVPNIERNMRMYVGRTRGVSLTEIAKMERMATARAYQIISATEYQLSKGNPEYWEAYHKYTGTYAKV